MDSRLALRSAPEKALFRQVGADAACGTHSRSVDDTDFSSLVFARSKRAPFKVAPLAERGEALAELVAEALRAMRKR
jgi:hypothetical protein